MRSRRCATIVDICCVKDDVDMDGWHPCACSRSRVRVLEELKVRTTLDTQCIEGDMKVAGADADIPAAMLGRRQPHSWHEDPIRSQLNYGLFLAQTMPRSC